MKLKTIIREFRKAYAIPKDGKSKSPCSKCIGVVGCAIKWKRKPDKECGAFWNKYRPIVITMKD